MSELASVDFSAVVATAAIFAVWLFLAEAFSYRFSDQGPESDNRGSLGQAGEEVRDRAVERVGLVEVGGVAGAGDHDLLRAGDLAGHVVGGGEKILVFGADQHQRRHGDRRQ